MRRGGVECCVQLEQQALLGGGTKQQHEGRPPAAATGAATAQALAAGAAALPSIRPGALIAVILDDELRKGLAVAVIVLCMGKGLLVASGWSMRGSDVRASTLFVPPH